MAGKSPLVPGAWLSRRRLTSDVGGRPRADAALECTVGGTRGHDRGSPAQQTVVDVTVTGRRRRASCRRDLRAAMMTCRPTRRRPRCPGPAGESTVHQRRLELVGLPRGSTAAAARGLLPGGSSLSSSSQAAVNGREISAGDPWRLLRRELRSRAAHAQEFVGASSPRTARTEGLARRLYPH